MIRTLMRSVREYKAASILSVVFIALEVIMEIFVPTLMAHLIDEGINGQNTQTIVTLGSILVVIVLLAVLFGVLAGEFSARASAGLAKNLRKDMFYKIQEYSFANIDKFSTASIVTRLTTDITNVQLAYLFLLVIAVRSPIMLIFSLVMSFSIHVTLTLIFAAAVPVLGVGLFLLIRVAFPYFGKVFRTYDKLNSVVQENLVGIRVVKSFVREDFEEDKFSKVSQKIFKNFYKAEGILAFITPLMQFVMYACIILLCWFGGTTIISSGSTELTTGELSSLIAYAMNILTALMMLAVVFFMINLALPSSRRIVEILTEESTLKNGPNPVYEMKNGEIRFENVSFSYTGEQDKEFLKNINLHIPSGSTLGIVGATGSGRSSLAHLIPRLYDVTEGKVTVGGVDVKDYDLFTLRNEVAVVLQKNELFSGTIKENLRWGNKDASDEELIHACELAQAAPFIETFPDKYDTYIEQGGTNVSGGQKQRLCIARALLKHPKILILDDSTSAVDTKTDAKIRKAFREKIPHTTKIIIAQRISSVEDADCIIVMDAGKINGCGTHEELLQTNAIYKEIYESQTKGEDNA